MKNSFAVLIGILLLISGCQQLPFVPHDNPVSFTDAEKNSGLSSGIVKLNFVAVLNGAQEVPPVNTLARGLAKFQLNTDGTELSFLLNVANIMNVTAAHIHLGPAGENGPVVAWLYPSGPPPVPIPGRFNGRLAQSIITDEDLVGPLLGETLDDLIEEMRNGNAYVNVHTTQNPGGEIRGKIAFGNGMISAE